MKDKNDLPPDPRLPKSSKKDLSLGNKAFTSL